MNLPPINNNTPERNKLPSSIDRKALLISFTNQASTPNCSLCILDPSNGDSKWINLDDIPLKSGQKSFTGTIGICNTGKTVVIVTQGTTPILACVNINEAKIASYIVLAKIKDPHSLVFHNNFIYIVSTGTNQIYKVSFDDGQFGQEELFWSYPDVDPDNDQIHLNGLAFYKGYFIASCFGPRNQEGKWGVDGRIFYLNTGQTICGGLNQPHSPIVIDEQLIFAESGNHKVHIYQYTNNASWNSKKEIRLEGYTRGVTLLDGKLFVGISTGRTLSRSKGHLLINNHKTSNNSYLIEINYLTGRQVKSLNLTGYGFEPYDILPIKTYSDIGLASDVIATRIRAMELSLQTYREKKPPFFKKLHASITKRLKT